MGRPEVTWSEDLRIKLDLTGLDAISRGQGAVA